MQAREIREDHAIWICQNVVVPEPDDREALTFKPSRPALIFGLLPGMLSAVEFNCETPVQANEIDDIGTDRKLPAKAQAGSLLGSQLSP